MNYKFKIIGLNSNIKDCIFGNTDSAREAIVFLKAAKKLNSGKAEVVGFSELELERLAQKET